MEGQLQEMGERRQAAGRRWSGEVPLGKDDEEEWEIWKDNCKKWESGDRPLGGGGAVKYR